jgi:hypothetical protein
VYTKRFILHRETNIETQRPPATLIDNRGNQFAAATHIDRGNSACFEEQTTLFDKLLREEPGYLHQRKYHMNNIVRTSFFGQSP